jgi:superfamily II DNA/RNA helicase
MFDFPRTGEDFLHRAGRTGRAGRAGRVTCLVGSTERKQATAAAAALDTGQPLLHAFGSATRRGAGADGVPSSEGGNTADRGKQSHGAGLKPAKSGPGFNQAQRGAGLQQAKSGPGSKQAKSGPGSKQAQSGVRESARKSGFEDDWMAGRVSVNGPLVRRSRGKPRRRRA